MFTLHSGDYFPADLADLSARLTPRYAFDANKLFDSIASGQRFCLVANDCHGTLGGFVLYRQSSKAGFVTVEYIGVEPEYQRCGIGRLLLTGLEKAVSDARMLGAYCYVPDSQLPVGHQFFRERGWTLAKYKGTVATFKWLSYFGILASRSAKKATKCD